MQKVALDLLFETSWEVCNKIGGIYTVLSTKAKTLQTLYKDKVVLLVLMFGLTKIHLPILWSRVLCSRSGRPRRSFLAA